MRVLILWLCLLSSCTPCWAKTVVKETNVSGYSVNQWCAAIYIAEGGAKTAFPYGILKRYRHTSARKACENTILHYWRDYSKLQGKTGKTIDFIAYSQRRYCPIGSDTDN